MPEGAEPEAPQGEAAVDELVDDAIGRGFSAAIRELLLELWFGEHPDLTPAYAWQHVYRLLLWIDPTIGLAHIYESDKCQPGRPWYERSLHFHRWLAEQFGVPPVELADQLDWLFRTALPSIAAGLAQERLERADAARSEMGIEMPLPGEDPEVPSLVYELLQEFLRERPPAAVDRLLVERLQAYFTVENKRKNLLGEGFEDVLAAILGRVLSASPPRLLASRAQLPEIGGFYAPRPNEKPPKVDLAIVRGDRRTLISCKWSVRADRERQYTSDFEAYTRLEATGEPFEHVLVTNEFDPARLYSACSFTVANAPLFTTVVHVQPEGPLLVRGNRGRSLDLPALIESGRIVSLQSWLESLVA